MIDFVNLKALISAGCAHFTDEERKFLVDAIDKHAPQLAVTLMDGTENSGGQIDKIYAYLSVDDGGEGMCAAPIGSLGAVPLVATKIRVLPILRERAEQLSLLFRKPVRCVSFKRGDVLETITP